MKEGSHEDESCSDLSRYSIAINMVYCQKRICNTGIVFTSVFGQCEQALIVLLNHLSISLFEVVT